MLYFYYKPQIKNVSVTRDKDAAGVFALVSATRYYCNSYQKSLDSDPINNFCEIRCRYRLLPNGTRTDWITILASDDSTTDSVSAKVYGLSEDASYEIEVAVRDSVGNEANTKVILTTDAIFMDRDGEMNSISIGESVVEKDTVSIAEKMTVKIKGALEIAGKTVAEIAKEQSDVVFENLNGFKESVMQDIENLQSQLDGNITTWFYDYVPTASNEPASNWTTVEDKNSHLGDLFYVVDNETHGGLVYRWVLTNGTYQWSQVEDSEVAKALEQAAEAKDIADSKRRVFITQPTPPYDVGDLWAQGSNGDLMRCVTARTSAGSYMASDWELASKYIDAELAKSLAHSIAKEEIGEANLLYADDVVIESSTTKNGITTQKIKVGNNEYTSITNGDFVLINMPFGTDTADGSQPYTYISKDGLLTAKNALIYGTIHATGGKFVGDVVANSLTLGSSVMVSANNVDGLSSVATSGSYGDLDGTPALSKVATSGNYDDLDDTPNLSKVATSGNYNDLSNKPTIPETVTELIGGENILYADDVSVNTAVSANGVTTQKITVGGKEYTSITAGDFVLTNIGLGTDSTDGSKRYVCISKDGLLTAKNAMIYGTIFATAGEIGGCSIVDGELKIKAANITDTITIGQLPSNVAKTSDIRTKTSQLDNDSGYQDYSGVVSIAKGTINADHIKTLGLEVGNQIKMGSNAKISWNNVTDKSGVATQDYVKSQGYETAESIKNTVITKDYIETLKITAENISGTTLTGKTISGGSISIGSNFSVDSSGTLKALNGEIAGIKLRSQGLRYDGGTGNGFGIWKGNTHGDSGSYIIFHAGADYSKDSLASAPFRVYQNGNVVANAITCKNADIEGKVALSTGSSIGSFKTDGNSIYNGKWDDSGGTPPNVFMCKGSSNSYKIGGSEQISGWAFGAGTSFGVTKDGELYASAGKIGSWSIGKTNFGTQYTDVECLWGVTGEEETASFQKVGLNPFGLYFAWYDDTPGTDQYIHKYIRWSDFFSKLMGE